MKEMGDTNKETNRQRLVDQNKKLRSEILVVAREVDEVIKKKSMNLMVNRTEDEEYQKKRKDLITQEQYILKLKAKIHQLKSTVIVGSDSLVRREQDKVTQLRKEFAKLVQQKQTLLRLKNDKARLLKIRDDPHQQHLSKVQELLISTKLQNRQLLQKIVPLQRIVRREHELSVIGDKAQNQKEVLKIDNIEHVITNLQLEIKSNEELKRSIEDKWSDKIENLDKNLFQMRAIYEIKQKRHDELVKQLRSWQTKSHNLRDEGDIKQIKQRLAKIITKPKAVENGVVENKGTKFIFNNSTVEKKNETVDGIRKVISKEKSSDLIGDMTNESFLIDRGNLGSPRKSEVRPLKSYIIEQKNFEIKPQSPQKEVQQQTLQYKMKVEHLVESHVKKEIGRTAWTPRNEQKNKKKKKSLISQEHNELVEVSSHDLDIQKSDKKEKKLLKSVAVGTSLIEH